VHWKEYSSLFPYTKLHLSLVYFSFVCFLSRLLESRTQRIPLCIYVLRSWLTAYIFFATPFLLLPGFHQGFRFRLWLGFNFSWLLEARLLAICSKKGMTTCLQCHTEPKTWFPAHSLTILYLSSPLFGLPLLQVYCYLIQSLPNYCSIAIISTPVLNYLLHGYLSST